MAKAVNTNKNTKPTTPVVALTAPVETIVETSPPPAPEVEGEEPVENNAKPLDSRISKQLIEKMLPYQDAYPTNKVFFICSDGQVFLDTNKIDAENHEKTLGGILTQFGQ